MSESQKVKNTKEIIQTCFLKLLAQKTIDKITVRELCSHANVHRGTFYRYYTDMYDLASQIEDELYKKFEIIYSTSQECSLHEIINRFIHLIYKEKLACGTLFKYKSSTDFFHRVADMGRMYLYKQPPLNQLNDLEVLYIYNCICAGVLGVIQTWISHDFQESPEKIIYYLERCMSVFFVALK